MNDADLFAEAVINGELGVAREILKSKPEVVRTGNLEEDRLLADIAGRDQSQPVASLIAWGADLLAPGLDGGTPLHQASWFGQPANVRLLINAGASLEIFDPTHNGSPLGWAVHGSRYSGDAENRQGACIDLVQILLSAGSKLTYPGRPESDEYYLRLLEDAFAAVKKLLRSATEV